MKEGDVAEKWGRRWVTIDTSRVALAFARTRLMSACFSSYLLSDSSEGRLKESELTSAPLSDGPVGRDVKMDFVYQRVPHITLKSIGNNLDAREGMTREEIDAVTRRHFDQELLYDQPYEDKKRVGITGRFTVESLSPYRVRDPDEERPATEVAAEIDANAEGFVPTVLAVAVDARPRIRFGDRQAGKRVEHDWGPGIEVLAQHAVVRFRVWVLVPDR